MPATQTPDRLAGEARLATQKVLQRAFGTIEPIVPVPVKRRVRKALPRSVRKYVDPGWHRRGIGGMWNQLGELAVPLSGRSRPRAAPLPARRRLRAAAGRLAVHRVPRDGPLLRHRPPLRPDRGRARLRPAPARPACQAAGAARAAPLRVRHAEPAVRLRPRPVGVHAPEHQRDHALPGRDGPRARAGRQVLRHVLRERPRAARDRGHRAEARPADPPRPRLLPLSPEHVRVAVRGHGPAGRVPGRVEQPRNQKMLVFTHKGQ